MAKMLMAYSNSANSIHIIVMQLMLYNSIKIQ